MITWNKKMTEAEAIELHHAKDGYSYPDTEHNRDMMFKQVEKTLKKLWAERDEKNKND